MSVTQPATAPAVIAVDAFHALCARAHAGQVDKAGRPYMGHVERVFDHALRIIDQELPDGAMTAAERHETLIAALGHDLIEDTGETRESLLAAGAPERSVAMIEGVTKAPGAVYVEAIRAIADSGDVGMIVVKLADNADNGNPERLAQLPPERAAKLNAKYKPARAVLLEGLVRALEARHASTALPGA